MNTSPDTPASLPFAPSAPSRILIVDDDPEMLRLEANILQRDGHRVDTVANGELAWKALVRGDYDLVLTDYIMPKVSGLALVRQMRVADMMLPVMMVSANLSHMDATKLSADPWSRIDAVLHKPFEVDHLLSAVNRVLGRELVEADSGRYQTELSTRWETDWVAENQHTAATRKPAEGGGLRLPRFDGQEDRGRAATCQIA